VIYYCFNDVVGTLEGCEQLWMAAEGPSELRKSCEELQMSFRRAAKAVYLFFRTSRLHRAAQGCAAVSGFADARTNLKTLTPWTSFPNDDIHQAIQFATTCAHLPSNPPIKANGIKPTLLV
jgi:hypothetical protein